MFLRNGAGGARNLTAFCPNAQGAEMGKFFQDGIIDMYCFMTSHMFMFLKNNTLADAGFVPSRVVL